jgi:hypothetical protein
MPIVMLLLLPLSAGTLKLLPLASLPCNAIFTLLLEVFLVVQLVLLIAMLAIALTVIAKATSSTVAMPCILSYVHPASLHPLVILRLLMRLPRFLPLAPFLPAATLPHVLSLLFVLPKPLLLLVPRPLPRPKLLHLLLFVVRLDP